MKNELPYVSSTYFIALIKAYLQGHKTRQEVLAEAAGVLELDALRSWPSHADVTTVLTELAREMNENFYADIVHYINYSKDTVPNRAGLIRHLRALSDGKITVHDLLEWATWYRVEDDELSAGIFDDFAVEFFCLDFLPAHYKELTPEKYAQALRIFHHQGQDPLKEKVALLLLVDKERQNFLFYLRNYLTNGALDTLDTYLMKKFGMDRQSFPYSRELNAMKKHPEKLEELLKQASL